MCKSKFDIISNLCCHNQQIGRIRRDDYDFPPNIETTSTTIQGFFNKEEIEEVARCTKFVQRYSPLNSFIFLQAVIFAFIDDRKANLDDLAQACADLEVEISLQGID